MKKVKWNKKKEYIECWEHNPDKSKICDFEFLSPINSVLANCHGRKKYHPWRWWSNITVILEYKYYEKI